QDAMVPVEYKPLPTGRSFMFNSRHEAVYNAVVDAKTPKVVSVRNTTRGTIRIPKRHPVGQIEEVEDSGYFACSWDTAFAALTMGTAQTARSVAAADAGVDTAFLVGQQVDVVPVNAEFDLNSKARAILDRGSTTAMGAEKPAVPEVQLAQATSPADFDSTLSDTPMIDHVFQLTQTVNTGLQTNMEEDNRMPRVPQKHSTLGLKMEESLPETVTKEGVHIYAADPALAQQFEEVVNEFPLL
ncbi:hypothetical protein P885DRAFT_11334, partial [Corynascus similis CBS 632.67]